MRSGLRASKVESFNYEYEIPAEGVPLQSKKVTPATAAKFAKPLCAGSAHTIFGHCVPSARSQVRYLAPHGRPDERNAGVS